MKPARRSLSVVKSAAQLGQRVAPLGIVNVHRGQVLDMVKGNPWLG